MTGKSHKRLSLQPLPLKNEIRVQLEHILHSPDFQASSRLKNFLKFIVEETLAGRANQLKAYTVAVEVFNKGKDFDPQTNPTIRMEAAKLRSKLEHYYYIRKNQDNIKLEIPKGGYIPTFEYISEPYFLLSTIEESKQNLEQLKQETAAINNSGSDNNSKFWLRAEQIKNLSQDNDKLKFEIDSDKDLDLVKENLKLNVRPFASDNELKSGSLEFLSQKKSIKNNQEINHSPSVIILPFTNLCKDPLVDPLISGLVEEITIGLTKFSDLTVFTARGSFENNNPSTKFDDFIRQCGARFILYGSAQISTSIIRMRVVLSDALTHTNIWADKFEGNLTAAELFSIQDGIAQEVVARVGGSYGLINYTLHKEGCSKRTDNLESYEAVLYYHYWIASLVPERFVVAQKALEAAIERDPNYSIVAAMLSDVYSTHYKWAYNLFGDSLDRAIFLSDKAIEIDPNCQYSQWSRAFHSFLRQDMDNFLNSVHRAVEINPSNSNISCAAGMQLCMAGEWEDGRALIKRALALNPHIPVWYSFVFFVENFLAKDYEVALNQALQINIRGFIGGPIFRAVAYAKLGNKEKANQAIQELHELRPNFSEFAPKIINRVFFDKKLSQNLLIALKEAGLN